MSDDIGPDISTSPVETADGRWFGYDDLAALRRIDRPSAIKLATRKGWQRRKNNAGLMQVLVPMDWLAWAERRRDRYGDSPSIEGDMSAALSSVREAFDITLKAKDGEISALRGQVDAHVAQLVEVRAAAMRAELQASVALERLTQAEATVQKAEHDRAAAVAIADEAVRAAEDLRQAEAKRAGQGRWARLRAAWRGA